MMIYVIIICVLYRELTYDGHFSTVLEVVVQA